MIGKNQIQLGADQIISGMSSSDYATDGALGVSSMGLNPFVTPGIMRSIAGPSEISASVVIDNLIATCEDSNAASPNNRYMLGDAGNYYTSTNGVSITKKVTGSDTYIAGKTDLISFAGFFYGTSTTHLTKWDGSASLTENFKSFGDGNAHHPLLAYQGFLMVGDGNTVSSLQNDNSTYNTNVLVLQSKEKIVAFGIDPQTGLMMISIQTVYDVSDTIPSLKAVYLWDGISAKAARKILVDDLITAFYNVEGQVYIGAGRTLGVWNGNGVTFLRKLQNVALNNVDLPYKHHFSNTRNILHVIDGPQVLSYGAVVSGKHGFFYTANTQGGSTSHITCVFPVGFDHTAIAYSPSGSVFNVYSFDFSSTSAGGGTMYFNNIYFPRPIFVRRMRIFTTGITTTAGIGGTAIVDEKGVINQSQVNTFVVLSANSPQYIFDYDFTSLEIQAIQPRINFGTQGFGFVRAIVYYDVAQ